MPIHFLKRPEYGLQTARDKVKGKVVPELFNSAPRHEGALGEERYSSTHF
jgi:hypothetical protein